MAAPELIVEDGTVSTPSANTYVTAAEVTTFCSNLGLTWSTNATLQAQAILRAMSFVESEYDFKGEKLSYDDPLEWPRYGIYEDTGVDPSEDLIYYEEIPEGLKKAVCRAAYEELTVPGCLQTNLVSDIKRETVDVLTTEYFGKTVPKTVYRTIEGYLKGLIVNIHMVNVKRT